MKHRRKDGMVKRTIDYIFFDDKQALEVKNILKPVADTDVDKNVGNPSKNHPSDHYH